MAFDPSPTTWLGAGYSLASHVVGLTTVTAGSNIVLEQLTDTLADPTTGDIRAVSMAISEALFQAWLAQSGADRPTKMTLARSTTGSGTSTVFTYTFKFTVDPTEIVVSNE